jgi:Ca2+-transporting ATPase
VVTGIPAPGVQVAHRRAGADWHALDPADVLSRLQASPAGLPDGERARRLARYGPNAPAGPKKDSVLGELAEAVTEPLQLLLLAVGVLSWVFGRLEDAVAIFVVIAMVIVTETVTELRAAKAIDALRRLAAPTARIRLGDAVTEVPAAGLVPGDVLSVEAGDLIPADARVLAAERLRVDESTLTGEAEPAAKGTAPVPAGVPLAGRACMLYAGTAVAAGEGAAVVTATGPGTELGQLGRLVRQEKEPPTPLQRSLAQLAKVVLVFAVAASVLVPAIGVLAGRGWHEMLLDGLTLAFATVPEELPILVTVLLAVAGHQLARRGAVLRRLRAGEALGSVTVVVTDKTGTLTRNRLRLAGICGDRALVLATAMACQPPGGTGQGREPIETELAAAAAAAGIGQPGEQVAMFPFDPARKLASRAWRTPAGLLLAVSGAPEAVLARCALRPEDGRRAEAQAGEFAAAGWRVIGFARRQLEEVPASRDAAENRLEFAGLAAFADPLRPGVPGAVAELSAAGVATIMVTGDHPATAVAVAAQAGLPAGPLLHGDQLTGHDEQALCGQLTAGTVVARSTPAGKLRIVRALQNRGEVVAVTGDGVNDAPALAAADVGIAMGRRGSDLARQAAGLVLTDDAYPTVAAAIAKGRNITAQLRRAVSFYLGAKLALILAMLVPLAAGRPAPFAPVHIVLLELFMDLGASVAFVAEPAAPDAMRRPPRPPGTRFLGRAELAAITTVAAALATAVLPAYLIMATTASLPAARAAAVLGWLAGHALIAWTLRAQPRLPVRSNPAFPGWALAAALTALAVTLTPLGGFLRLTPLTATATAITATGILTATILAIIAGRKLALPARL